MVDMTHDPGTLTGLLRKAQLGDRTARDAIFARTYSELRGLALQAIAKTPAGAGVDATSLVNAACQKLLSAERLDAENRRHFFFLLGRAIHDVLVDHARAETAAKRGGGRRSQSLVQVEEDGNTHTFSVLELHQALKDLTDIDRDAAEVVRLRYFSGLSLRDAADVMGCTLGVARGHWDYAKAWLHERIAGRGSPSP